MIYLILFLTVLFLSINFKQKGRDSGKWNGTYILLFTLITSVAAFAYKLGADTEEYYNVFKSLLPIEKLTTTQIESYRYQPGFLLFMSASKQLCDSYLLFQIFHAIIINYVLFRFVYNNTTNPYLAILFYLILNFLEFNFEIQRESMSVACGLICIELIQKRKYIYSIIPFIIGFYFHISIICLLIIPFLKLIKSNRKNIILFSAIIAISPWIWQAIPNAELFLFFISNDEYFQNYINQTLFDNYNLVYYIKFYLTNIGIPVFALYILRNKELPYKYLVYGYMLFRCLSLFSYGFYRFSNYYVVFYWIALSDALFMYAKSRQSMKAIIYILVPLLIFYLNSTSLFWTDEETGKKVYERYFPYESVLEYNNDY